MLLHISIRAYVNFEKTDVRVLVKYCGFKIYEYPSKDKNKKDKQEKAEASEISESEDVPSEPVFTEITDDVEAVEPEVPPEDGEDTEDQPQERQKKKAAVVKNKKTAKKPKKDGKTPLKEKWEEIKPFFPVAKKGLKKLLKLIRFYHLDLELTVGGSDPYQAGMNFARANQVFYPALALFCRLFTVGIDRTKINCDYNNSTFDIGGSVVVMARPSAIICLLIYLGVNYLKITLLNNKKEGNKNE